MNLVFGKKLQLIWYMEICTQFFVIFVIIIGSIYIFIFVLKNKVIKIKRLKICGIMVIFSGLVVLFLLTQLPGKENCCTK
jgi:hypothetical protein